MYRKNAKTNKIFRFTYLVVVIFIGFFTIIGSNGGSSSDENEQMSEISDPQPISEDEKDDDGDDPVIPKQIKRKAIININGQPTNLQLSQTEFYRQDSIEGVWEGEVPNSGEKIILKLEDGIITGKMTVNNGIDNYASNESISGRYYELDSNKVSADIDMELRFNIKR